MGDWRRIRLERLPTRAILTLGFTRLFSAPAGSKLRADEARAAAAADAGVAKQAQRLVG